MIDFINIQKDFNQKGFAIVPEIYNSAEIEKIIELIDSKDSTKNTFRRTEDLFAIRQFHKEIPEVLPFIFNENFRNLVTEIAKKDYFIVKSIYFDKPGKSNWFVSYHQDLTISVDNKLEIEGFQNWTTKQNQFAVQPTLDILENIITFRIHLDNTTHENGALRVIENSHSKGIYRPENINYDFEMETICEVGKGGVMLMKPLTLHASNRTKNEKRRRVIHIEMSNKNLPDGLNWSEKSL